MAVWIFSGVLLVAGWRERENCVRKIESKSYRSLSRH